MSHQQGQDHPGNHGISCFTQGALLADWLPPLFALTQLGTGGKGGSGDPPQLPDGGRPCSQGTGAARAVPGEVQVGKMPSLEGWPGFGRGCPGQ